MCSYVLHGYWCDCYACRIAKSKIKTKTKKSKGKTLDEVSKSESSTR